MTPKEVKALKQFISSAVTRAGLPFKVTSMQVDLKKVPTSLKGFVYFKENEKDEDFTVETPIIWNMQGQAMTIGQHCDLVEEKSFEDFDGIDLDEN